MKINNYNYNARVNNVHKVLFLSMTFQSFCRKHIIRIKDKVEQEVVKNCLSVWLVKLAVKIRLGKNESIQNIFH